MHAELPWKSHTHNSITTHGEGVPLPTGECLSLRQTTEEEEMILGINELKNKINVKYAAAIHDAAVKLMTWQLSGERLR